MTNEPTIREQSLQYFLVEAPELLQAIEKDLFSLRENYSINKIYDLMRTTHTLKGAAASVGLEVLTSVAHSLEDIFRAICKPDLSIDSEVEALLFEGYECLRLPLTAALTGGQVNDVEVLERTAAVFAQLQEKLGDCFSQEAELPSSEELGFDLTESIFEVGVSQRLDRLATALASGDENEITATLRECAEIFQLLSESLQLPGFGSIAQTAIAALNANPEQALFIAEIAFSDFQKAQTAVLNGDRTVGGQPSLTLENLAISGEIFVNDSEPHSQEPDNSESANSLLEAIWGGFEQDEGEEAPHQGAGVQGAGVQGAGSAGENSPTPVAPSPFASFRDEPKPTPQKDHVSLCRSVRVKVEHLEQINYSIEELLTNQNRQSLENEQLRSSVRVLISRVQQHYSLLDQLKDKSLRDNTRQGKQGGQGKQGRQGGYLPITHYPLPITSSPLPITQSTNFDSLELNRYSDFQVLIQSILEDAVQLAEAADAIDLFTRASAQTMEKQRRQLAHTRDAVMAARMSPLGDIFGRFSLVLQQLETIRKKPVALELRGTEVLVDKVVGEKLYDPLLHLVRNAFDHGIESPDVRQQWGKPEKGQIAICAYHRGRHLVIEVRDDGQGLDFEKIRVCAVERQFVSPELANSMSEAELTDLLFETGFSTVKSVSELSGRGIGLDVVKSQLQAFQGSIEVCSERHQGTTFILQIPLALTIGKLLLVQAGGKTYALFTDVIVSIVIPTAGQIRSWEDGKVLRWGDGSNERLVPIYQISQVLNYSSQRESPTSGNKDGASGASQMMPVIIISSQDRFLALEVDQLLGEQELVIRPLGHMMAPPSYVYGGSILANGMLSLVLDTTELMQYILKEQTAISNDSLRDSYVTQASLYTDKPRQLLRATPRTLSSPQQGKLPEQNRAALLSAANVDFTGPPDKTVLVVDDSITVRQTLAFTLQKAGYQVIQAHDGYEAIELLGQSRDIHLVICDIEMPRMNGFEFLKHRCSHPQGQHIPVIMLTSRSGDKHRAIASQLGAIGYLTKPFLEHKLLATVKEVMAHTAARIHGKVGHA
jgi:chemotaxis protein histidine kinase CheA/CheY-like chemotaxis protein